ncbi:MAG: DASH family cryptochrome [Candidatus Woesearchaeota archaeon]
MGKNILIYITATLRGEYNELFEDISKDDTIIPLFIYNQDYISNMSEMRKEFLYQAVQDFKQSLQEKYNLPLYEELSNNIAQTLQDYVKIHSIDEVRVEYQFSYNEIIINEKLQSYCKEHSIRYKEYETLQFIELKNLPFKDIQQIPNQYTKFRKIVESHNCYSSFTLPSKLPIRFVYKHQPLNPPLSITRKQVKINSSNIKLRYTPSRRVALEHLNEYIFEKQHILTYKETRNQMLGESYSTKFSPYLALGILSPKEILESINSFEENVTSNSSTYWIKFELLWREYCKWISVKFKNKVFAKTGIMQTPIYEQFNEKFYNAFTKGKTGYPLVDAGVRELIQTGFMSNRARQNVASFFVKNLHLPWLLGAEFFEKYLLDYEPCSNYLNWQYIAGCGTDTKEFRYFNIYKQTNDYDKDRKYVSYWVYELDSSSYQEEIVDFYKSIQIAKKEQERVNNN